jgi:hypothetical protein
MLRETTKTLLSALVSGLLITALQATVTRAARGDDDEGGHRGLRWPERGGPGRPSAAR